MDASKKIVIFVKKLKRRFLLLSVFNFSLDFFSATVVFLFLFIVMALVNAYFTVEHYFAVVFFWFFYLLLRYVKRFGKRYNDESLIKYVESRFPSFADDISTSYSFIKTPMHFVSETSLVFKNEHLEKSCGHIENLEIKKVMPFEITGRVADLSAAMLILAAYIFVMPVEFRYALNNLLRKPLDIAVVKITPGDAEVSYGDSVTISASLPAEVPFRPSLLISTKYEKTSIEDMASKKIDNKIIWSYRYDKVIDDIKYKFKIGTSKTKEYIIKTVRPIVFRNIEIRYTYPQYTGLPEKMTNNEPNMECYEGTLINITAKAEESIDFAELFFENRSLTMRLSNDGKTARLSMKASKSETYKFAIRKNSKTHLSSTYRIDVLKDLPPKIDIISPAQDLLLSGDETIPIIYSFEDDFGVSSLKLVYKSGDSQNEIPLKFDRKKGGLGEHLWGFGRISAKPGDTIKYYLSATDGNGSEGFSKTFVFEIATYEKNHKNIMRELDKFSNEVLRILSEQIAAREKLRSQKTPPWEGIKEAQKKILDSVRNASGGLKETLKKMLEDPFFDGYLMSEYRGMEETLNYLERKPLSGAVNFAEKQDAHGVESNQTEAISLLEKLSLLSQDVMKHQNLSDLESKFADMEKKFDLAFENIKEHSAQELMAQMEEISEIMKEIENLIRDMPQILPEEFINSSALKNMDFKTAQDAASAIKDALMKSNFEEAKKIMENLKDELKKMRDAMRKAAENLAIKSAPREISGQLSDLSRKMKEIIKKQEELYTLTSKHEDSRLKKVFSAQKKLLKELAVRQKELNRKADLLKVNIPGIAQSQPLMERIYGEFSSGKVHNSQKYLQDVLTNLSNIKEVLLMDAKEPKKDDILALNEILSGEKEILEILRKTPATEFSQSEQNEMNAVSKRQSSLRDELNDVRKNLSKITAATAAIPYQILSNMSSASAEMGASSENLSRYDTFKSLENQKNAIDLLSNLLSDMESASASMGAMSYGQKPVPSLRPRGPGGIYGVRLGKVELPGADEFKVPQEFRSEILKALQEKYPEEYEKLIQKYYRKLIGQ